MFLSIWFFWTYFRDRRNVYINGALLANSMPKESRRGGFQSAAGLIRYFEEEESEGPKLDPKLIVYIGIVMAICVELAKVFWPI